MKPIVYTLLFFVFPSLGKGQSEFINPTGIYTFGDPVYKNQRHEGSFGEIQVKLLDSCKIVVSLLVCVGAPGYNYGSFIDTMIYRNNQALHSTMGDSSCKITFRFSRKGVIVYHYQKDINFGCEFGQGVFAAGFYEKKSSRVTRIYELKDKYFPLL